MKCRLFCITIGIFQKNFSCSKDGLNNVFEMTLIEFSLMLIYEWQIVSSFILY